MNNSTKLLTIRQILNDRCKMLLHLKVNLMFKSPIEESFYFIESESSDATDTYKLQSGQTSMQNGISEIKAEVDIKFWLYI